MNEVLGLIALVDLVLRTTDSKKLDKLNKKIKKEYMSHKYGFTDSVDNAYDLYKISNTSLFKAFTKCVIHQDYISLIRNGLRISYLNDEGGRKQEISLIKDEVNTKYKRMGIRIMNIASTGELEHVVRYLVDLKDRKNYNVSDLKAEFENIVSKWDKISIFVKTTDNSDLIKNKINKLMDNKEELFFVFAYKNAVIITITSIAELNTAGIFHDKYLFEANSSIDGAGIEYYSCFFERLTI